jgi:hypothetical protein
MADPERPEPFRFTDPRQQRVHRRLLLLGPGPAAFFKDACRLMGTAFPLATTPHLVPHLLREVESALRDVLLPYGFERPTPCSHCGSRPGSHKKEIKTILAAYRFKETEDAAEAWLRLSSWDEDAFDQRNTRAAMPAAGQTTQGGRAGAITLMNSSTGS